jgi:aspartate aminotransferase-like enzyme
MNSQNPIFIPGPTNIPEALRKAVDMPTIDHRSPLFGEILHPALEGVKKVLKTTQGQIFVFPSTGTGGWETAITNVLSLGVVCGRGRNPTLRLWPSIFAGEVDVLPSERRDMGQEIGR